MYITVLLVFLPVVASAKEVIKIGALGPYKFQAGENAWRGIELAADEINAKGGVMVKGVKHEIELIKVDDNCFLSIPDCVSAMERTITVSKANFILGGMRSEGAIAQMEPMADYKTILLTVFSTAIQRIEKVAKNYDRYKYFFSVLPPNGDFSQNIFLPVSIPVMRKLRTELGITRPKVALVIEKSLWADNFHDQARELFSKLDCEIVYDVRIPTTAADLTAELSAIAKAGTHMILEGSAIAEAGTVLTRQWAELKIPCAIAGIIANAQQGNHWVVTKGLCNYLATADWIGRAQITEKTIPFYDNFVKRHGPDSAPGLTSVGAYDGLWLLKEAIERAGTLNSDAVVVELEKIKYRGAAGIYAFYPRGDKYAHDVKWGPGFVTGVGNQWRDGKSLVYFPDGQDVPPAFGLPSNYKEVKYGGSVEYQLPPWVVQYWKGKK